MLMPDSFHYEIVEDMIDVLPWILRSTNQAIIFEAYVELHN